MRGAILLLAILAVPSASAGVHLCTLEATCFDAWSARDGTCGGAGSERNVAAASSSLPHAGDASVFAETFCVRTGPTAYSEVRLEAAALGERLYVGWANDGGACTLVIFTEGAWLGSDVRREPCHGATPPMVPAALA